MDITPNEPPASGGKPEEPPTRPGSALPPRRMYRDPKGLVGGVASGFAGYFNIDPVITRLIWVVALFSGIGFPAYVLCWIVIPKAKSWPPPESGRPGTAGRDPNDKALISGLLIVALAALIGAGSQGLGDYLLPAALVGFGFFLLSQRERAPVPRSAGIASPVASNDVPSGAARAIWDRLASPASEQAEPEPTGIVTPTVLSILAIGLGISIAFHSAGISHVSPVAASAGALVLVGTGLVSSLWLGRARGLVPLGIALVVVMLAASAVPSFDSARWHRFRETMERHGSGDSAAVGDLKYAPKSLAELRPRYDLAMGTLSIDLSEIDFRGVQRDLAVDIGLGELKLVVPPDPGVAVRGTVGMGEAHALGRKQEGVSVRLENGDPGHGAGQLNIDVTVGLGKWDVHRSH